MKTYTTIFAVLAMVVAIALSMVLVFVPTGVFLTFVVLAGIVGALIVGKVALSFLLGGGK